MNINKYKEKLLKEKEKENKNIIIAGGKRKINWINK